MNSNYAYKIGVGLSLLAMLIAFLEIKLARFLWWDVSLDGKDFIIFFLTGFLLCGSGMINLPKYAGVKRGKLTNEEWKKLLFLSIVTLPALIALFAWFNITVGNSLSR